MRRARSTAKPIAGGRGERHQGRQQVALDHVVLADQGRRQRRARRRRGRRRARAGAPRRSRRDAADGDEQQGDADQDSGQQRVALARGLGDHVAGLADQEADPGLEEAGREQAFFDPADVGRVDLGRDQREQGEADEGDAADRRQHHAPARAQRDQQPERLDPDREEGEVVAAEGERRGERPERQVAAARGCAGRGRRRAARRRRRRPGARRSGPPASTRSASG